MILRKRSRPESNLTTLTFGTAMKHKIKESSIQFINSFDELMDENIPGLQIAEWYLSII